MLHWLYHYHEIYGHFHQRSRRSYRQISERCLVKGRNNLVLRHLIAPIIIISKVSEATLRNMTACSRIMVQIISTCVDNNSTAVIYDTCKEAGDTFLPGSIQADSSRKGVTRSCCPRTARTDLLSTYFFAVFPKTWTSQEEWHHKNCLILQLKLLFYLNINIVTAVLSSLLHWPSEEVRVPKTAHSVLRGPKMRT